MAMAMAFGRREVAMEYVIYVSYARRYRTGLSILMYLIPWMLRVKENPSLDLIPFYCSAQKILDFLQSIWKKENPIKRGVLLIIAGRVQNNKEEASVPDD